MSRSLFLLLPFLVIPLYAFAQTGTPCNQFVSGSAPPAGYGAAWNVLSSARELLLNTTCNAEGVTFTAGSGAANQYVFKTRYIFSGGAWVLKTLEGTFVQGSADWLAGRGVTTVSPPPSAGYFWVAFVCQWTGSTWKCGCRDAACATSFWQLQSYVPPGSGTTGGTTGSTTGTSSGDHDAKVRAAPGQVSDDYLRSSDVYYLGGEISASVKQQWNEYVNRWKNSWTEPKPTIRLSVNAKTDIRAGGWSHEPSMESDGVLNFNHRAGWVSDNSPERNYKHVTIRLIKKGYASNVAEWLETGVNYESGMTFWQGGTRNWLTDASGVAVLQIHGDDAVPIYIQGSGGGLSGFTRASPSAAFQRFSYRFPDQSHEAIHVLKFQYRLGSGGYFRMFHNGTKVYDSGSINFSGYTKYWLDFMNYSDYDKAGVEQVIYMDRLYRKRI